MEIHGHTWKYMGLHGNTGYTWQYVVMYGATWQSMGIHGNARQYMEIQWVYMVMDVYA